MIVGHFRQTHPYDLVIRTGRHLSEAPGWCEIIVPQGLTDLKFHLTLHYRTSNVAGVISHKVFGKKRKRRFACNLHPNVRI
jgi:hypothetical protein